MNKIRFLSLLLLLGYASFNTTSAHNPIGAKISTGSTVSYKTETGSCVIPVAQFDMDVNNVRARLLDAGDMWWDLSSAKYQVPKGNSTSGTQYPNAIFAGSIWVSALDQGNNLKMAAQLYRQGTTDFYTGPLDNSGAITQSSCNLWDQHFSVYGTEIKTLIDAYIAQGSTGVVPNNFIATSLKNWPGKGNPYLTAHGYDCSGVLAPFYDANGDGIYDPKDGDYPSLQQGAAATTNQCGFINSAYADQMVFWVMNDQGNVHTATNGAAMGIQINALAFAFQSSDDLNNATFYTYHIINKSGGVLKSTYISQFTDVDLGCSENDRIGCDTTRNLAIAYNGILGSNTADNGSACLSGAVGYGTELPILGVDLLQGPVDTTIDPSTHLPKNIKMTSFSYFSSAGGATTGDPVTAVQFRNYQRAFWKDGQPFEYGGDARTGIGSNFYPFAFSGDPSISTQWSECNTQTSTTIPAGDRRFLQSAGPFTFMPSASQFISLSVLFVQPPGGVGSNCPSWSLIDSAADRAQHLFNNCFRIGNRTGIEDLAANKVLVYPNPVSTDLFIVAQGSKPITATYIYDIQGQLVHSQTGNVTSLNLSALPSGVYFVKTNEQDAKPIKIVKE